MKKKLHYTTRRCALCDSVVADEHIVCKEHMPDYIKYKDEEWFQMCVASQRRQFEIDNEELVLKAGIIFNPKPYRKLQETEKYAIQFLRSKGLGARNIGKVLGIYEKTVQAYLKSLSKNKQRIV